MTTYPPQARAPQTHAEVFESSTKRSKRASTKRLRNKQWERRLEEDWQGHLEALRQCIYELLIGHQHLQMELMDADRPSREYCPPSLGG